MTFMERAKQAYYEGYDDAKEEIISVLQEIRDEIETAAVFSHYDNEMWMSKKRAIDIIDKHLESVSK